MYVYVLLPLFLCVGAGGVQLPEDGSSPEGKAKVCVWVCVRFLLLLDVWFPGSPVRALRLCTPLRSPFPHMKAV
jgi:hypothetical protein